MKSIRKEVISMQSITPRYVDENGRPLRAERSLWDWLFGYKPKYQTLSRDRSKPDGGVTEGKPAADR